MYEFVSKDGQRNGTIADMKKLKQLRIFTIALIVTSLAVAAKYFLHAVGWEVIEQTSLHSSVISSVIFVIGFVLSATIADYKESEKIPALFASTVENMYEDARETHKTYPGFSLNRFRKELLDIIDRFREGTRSVQEGTRREITDLDDSFTEMEAAGVPANFIVKLKQQQALLLNNMYRINYIQRIKFIPSAFVLVRSIVALVIGLMVFTNIDPFYGGLALTGMLSFILTYLLVLIHVVSVPFHPKGATRDDVSLFILDEARELIIKRAKTEGAVSPAPHQQKKASK